ncbi:MAG: glycosyltransferase family 2 protein [Gemmatimonadales bacterium]
MAETGITISVVIPAFNSALFLPRCLGSVFGQTLQPLEVIVVDDGSTDDTAAVAAALGAKLIRRTNEGVSAARNAGIRHAAGEWIALLDADDLWAPEKLERQAASIQPGTVLVYTGLQIWDDNGTSTERPATAAASAKKMLRYRNPIATSSVLARREVLLRDGGFREDVHVCEDWELWFRMRDLGSFEALADPLTHYYAHANSLSADPEKMIQVLDQIVDTTLLGDLRGLRRWVWRRRIFATQLCKAGLIARDNSLGTDLRYMLRSLSTWPSPLWHPRRFAIFAATLTAKVRS